MNEKFCEVKYFQGKWSALVDLINRQKIGKDRILNINTFMVNNEVMGVMFYYEEKE